MARGWESKSIEEQISAAEAEPRPGSKAALTADEAELRSKREGLLLLRAHALSELASTRHERRRGLLRSTLEHLERQIAALDSPE
jgi:hypothetical protein